MIIIKENILNFIFKQSKIRIPKTITVIVLKMEQASRFKKTSCLTQLSIKFFLVVNVKMPTVVGITTFMSRKNSILGLSESEKS